MSGFGVGEPGDTNFGGYLGNLGSAPPQQFTSQAVLYGFGDLTPEQVGFGDSTVYPGTILGVIDGANRTFSLGVELRRAQIWRNGVLMTLNVDVFFGGRYMLFSEPQTPVPGDYIMLFGWP